MLLVLAKRCLRYGLASLCEAAHKNKPIVVHDDGNQQRCFAHVSDVVQAIVKLTESPSTHGRVYNLGSDQPVTILKLAELVRTMVNPDVEIRFQSYSEAYDQDFEDIRRRVPDLTRIKNAIGYRPTRDLPSIIQDVWQWMKTKQ